MIRILIAERIRLTRDLIGSALEGNRIWQSSAWSPRPNRC